MKLNYLSDYPYLLSRHLVVEVAAGSCFSSLLLKPLFHIFGKMITKTKMLFCVQPDMCMKCRKLVKDLRKHEARGNCWKPRHSKNIKQVKNPAFYITSQVFL
jgi:hypothetical protein